MEKVALILEGGGMRGVYTAGVLDFFLEKEIEFEYCVGVSAGACQGTSYISKQHKRNYRVTVNYIKDKRYISFRNLVKTGSLFGMDMIFNKLPNELEPFDYEAFEKANTIFNVGTTNCETGLPEYYVINDLKPGYDAIKASISLPLIAPIVKYDQKILLDGGIVNPIPISKAIEDGYHKYVVILTQHKGYQKTKTRVLPFLKKRYKAYPKLIEAMEKRHEVYNASLEQLEQLEQQGKCFIIRPSSPLNMSRFETNQDKLNKVYDQGYQDIVSRYLKLKEFLK